MMAELCGKAAGYCKGKGGSMHIADVTAGNLGANGVVGGGIPIATGAGLSCKMRQTDQVVLCFFGDGATNQGVFHESLNMAATWRLPVVYICENNLYGMSVAVKVAFPTPDIYIRAAAYCMPGEVVDGMDVLAVKEVISKAVSRARGGEGPTLIECKTYRYFGHSRSDPRAYRTKEEEADWREKCPIRRFRQRLLDEKIATAGELEQIESQVQEEIEAAVKFALDAPYPSVDSLKEDLYV
jgi:TPP-dependent pyruvate/acetoin dehydrogenase alpha subunit